MFLAEEAAAEASRFDVFDLFIFAFTLLILFGLIRLAAAPQKNKFAIGFAMISLLVFLFVDYLIVRNWLGLL
jgi:accessory gene regulator protein AgrB